jgi:hypothetical protein
MEQQLLEILKDDSLWAGSNNFVRTAMGNTLERDGIDRFLTLYRYNNPTSLRAHQLLGFYYYASGRQERVIASDHLLFAFLIQNSVCLDELLRVQYNYTFTTLETLLNDIQGRSNLRAYLEETDYFKTMYYLGTAFYGSGKLSPARNFWTVVSGRPEAGEWRTRAQAQLRSPFVEQAMEMP